MAFTLYYDHCDLFANRHNVICTFLHVSLIHDMSSSFRSSPSFSASLLFLFSFLVMVSCFFSRPLRYLLTVTDSVSWSFFITMDLFTHPCLLCSSSLTQKYSLKQWEGEEEKKKKKKREREREREQLTETQAQSQRHEKKSAQLANNGREQYFHLHKQLNRDRFSPTLSLHC